MIKSLIILALLINYLEISLILKVFFIQLTNSNVKSAKFYFPFISYVKIVVGIILIYYAYNL